MWLILSISFYRKVGVLGCSRDVSSKLSVTLVGCVIFLLAILENCMSVNGACHSYCSSKEACGFVHNELMLLTSRSSLDWITCLVLLSVSSENLRLKLTLWELLTHLAVMLWWVDIRIACTPTCTRVVSIRSRCHHLYILLIILSIIFFNLSWATVLHNLRLLDWRSHHRTVVIWALPREEVLWKIFVFLQDVAGSILWSTIVAGSIWLYVAIIVFIALNVFLVYARMVHMMIR